MELPWFERELVFGKRKEMLPFYLERLRGTVVRIEEKVRELPENFLSTQFNNKWSVKENIGHLAEVDEIANKRIDEMVNGISPMSPAVFEPAKNYNGTPMSEVINTFRSSRKENINKYELLTDKQLILSSLHPRLKVMMTPVDLAWFDAEHDDHHLVKITEIISNFRQP